MSAIVGPHIVAVMKGAYVKRIALFVLTNVAVLVVLSVAARVLGLGPMLNEYGLNYTALIAYSAIIGFAGSFISLFISKFVAKATTGARVIKQPRSPDEVWLVETVQRLSRQAGIGEPEVAIYPSEDVNAFATGARRNHALVAVSSGLISRMNRREVEAVLGHEISHVANGDMITLALIQGVVNTFVIFLSRVVGYIVDRMVFRTERGYGPAFFITSIVAQIVLGILATTIVLWFSRRREFRADSGSADLVGATSMIAALQTLGRARIPGQLPEPLQAFGIREGGRGMWGRLFQSHPPLERRIAALEARGGRGP